MHLRRPLAGLAVAGLALTAAVGCEPAGQTVRPICFPVQGKVTYTDSWEAPRSGGRRHEGQDLMGTKMQKVLASVDGTIKVLKTGHATAGNYLYLQDADGWIHAYLHLNNDTPGTDDGRAEITQTFAAGLKVGAKVKKGELIGYLGDSGNAESTAPHLHFELRKPDGSYSGVAVNAYPSLQAAATCKVLPAGTGEKA